MMLSIVVDAGRHAGEAVLAGLPGVVRGRRRVAARASLGSRPCCGTRCEIEGRNVRGKGMSGVVGRSLLSPKARQSLPSLRLLQSLKSVGSSPIGRSCTEARGHA